MPHNHGCKESSCKHESVKFCKDCAKIFCQHCKMEWGEPCKQTHWSSLYYQYPPTYGAIKTDSTGLKWGTDPNITITCASHIVTE